MKKSFLALLLIILLVLCSCNKEIPKAENETTVKSSVVDFTDIPLYSELASSTHEIYTSLDEYTKNFNIADYIIFKGIKKNDSTQFLSIENGNVLYDWRSETPIQVLETYYGDVQAGNEMFLIKKTR